MIISITVILLSCASCLSHLLILHFRFFNIREEALMALESYTMILSWLAPYDATDIPAVKKQYLIFISVTKLR